MIRQIISFLFFEKKKKKKERKKERNAPRMRHFNIKSDGYEIIRQNQNRISPWYSLTNFPYHQSKMNPSPPISSYKSIWKKKKKKKSALTYFPDEFIVLRVAPGDAQGLIVPVFLRFVHVRIRINTRNVLGHDDKLISCSPGIKGIFN